MDTTITVEAVQGDTLPTSWYEVPDAGITVLETYSPEEGTLIERTVGVDNYFYTTRKRTANGGLESLPSVFIRDAEGKLVEVTYKDDKGETLEGLSREDGQRIIQEMMTIRHMVSDACRERLGEASARLLFRFVPIDDMRVLGQI